MTKLYPSYPYDDKELEHIDSLISKIPVYRDKIAGLHKDIERISKEMYKAGARSYTYELELLIYKAFYLELENREYHIPNEEVISYLKAETVHYQQVKNRNLPCEICGENRSIDRCHIIPNNIGGSATPPNLLYLCPTHHRLFDQFKLTRREWSKIDWNRKSKFSKEYALRDTLRHQEEFWSKYPELNDNHEPYLERESFLLFLAKELLGLLALDKPIKIKSIYSYFGDDLQKMIKQMLICFKECNLVVTTTKETMLVIGEPIISRDIINEFRYH